MDRRWLWLALALSACSLDEGGLATSPAGFGGVTSGGTSGVAGAGAFGGVNGGTGGSLTGGGGAGGSAGLDPDGGDAPTDTLGEDEDAAPSDASDGPPEDGDGGTLWKPWDFPNCAVWLDAADQSTIKTSGAAVDSWTSKCGGATGVGTGQQRPLLTVNSGRLAVHCDGVDDRLSLTNGAAVATEYTLLFVVDKAFGQPAQKVIWSNRDVAPPIGGTKSWIGFLDDYVMVYQDETLPTAKMLSGGTVGQLSLLVEYSASLTGSREIYMDGALSKSVLATTATSTSLGSGFLCYDSGNNEFGQYDIFEVVMYDRYLTGAERIVASKALALKWAL